MDTVIAFSLLTSIFIYKLYIWIIYIYIYINHIYVRVTIQPSKSQHCGPDRRATIFKFIFFNENRVFIKFSMFVPKDAVGSNNGLVQNRRQAIIWTTDLLTHKCVTGPRWVNWYCAQTAWLSYANKCERRNRHYTPRHAIHPRECLLWVQVLFRIM